MSLAMFLGIVNPLYRGAEPLTSSLFVSTKSAEYGDKNIQTVQSKVSEYIEAENKIDNIIKKRDTESEKRNSLKSAEQVLAKMVPASIDNVNLIVELENLSRKYTQTGLKNITIGGGKVSKTGETPSNVVIDTTAQNYNSVVMGFTVNMSYANFVGFLKDLETNMRLVDIEKISFSSTDTGNYDFSLVIRTYWMK